VGSCEHGNEEDKIYMQNFGGETLGRRLQRPWKKESVG
jgi:hypothetical protein